MTMGGATQAPTDQDHTKTPLDHLLDFGVFAPLGFALEFRRVLPELAQAGRRQIAFSQTLGRAALNGVTRGRPEPATRAEPSAPPSRSSTPSRAVDGYRGLSARDIVALVRHADLGQVEWIMAYEAEHKARVTVMRAAEQRLRAASST